MTNKIFISCGFYVGQALKDYIAKGVVDETWTVYAFEPSPIVEVEARVQESSVPIHLMKKAVWTHDGKVSFWLSKRNNASHIDGTSSSAEDRKITVPCLDFSHFVQDLPPAYIICSMDIEGAEYKVLEKMLADKTLAKLDVLEIEFHDRFMGHKTINDSQALLDQLLLQTAVKLEGPLR